MLHFQSHSFIYSFIHQSIIHQSPHFKELSHKTWGRKMWSLSMQPPTRTQKAYVQRDAAWFPKGIVYEIAIITPVPCSIWYDTFHLGFSRQELSSICCSNPLQDVPFTPFTTPTSRHRVWMARMCQSNPLTAHPPYLLPPPYNPEIQNEVVVYS
jgi:hypothetical protein